MEISHDGEKNKIISIPPIFADDNAEVFEYLNHKTLLDLDEQHEIKDLRIENKSDNSKSLIIEFSELLKPNWIFKFSQALADRMDGGEGEEFLIRCQFFFWRDQNGSHIRLARPTVEFIHEETIYGDNNF